MRPKFGKCRAGRTTRPYKRHALLFYSICTLRKNPEREREKDGACKKKKKICEDVDRLEGLC